MSKMTNALKKAAEERSNRLGKYIDGENRPLKHSQIHRRGFLQNSPLTWIFFGVVIVTVLFAFNYQGGKETIPLSEIFPDEETFPIDVEYEFVDASSPLVEQSELAKGVVSQAVDVAKKSVSKKVKVFTKSDFPVVESKPRVVASAKLKPIPFAIQVASFKKKTWAEKEVESLGLKGLKGYILSRNLGAKGIWYRVYVGKFNTKAEAQEYLPKAKEHYPSGFIISPSSK